MNRTHRTAPVRQSAILLVAALVLLGQAALGLHAPGWFRTASGPLEGFPICHAAEPEQTNDSPAKPDQQDASCAFCAICNSCSAFAALEGPALGSIQPPTPIASRGAPLPPARAPPARRLLAAVYPTGPPNLA